MFVVSPEEPRRALQNDPSCLTDMPSTRRVQCAEDCRCVLCRELKGLREMSGGGGGVEMARTRDEGANFILRRAVSFLPKAREAREVMRDDYYERSSTLEDKSRCGASATAAATTTTTKDDGRAGDPKLKAPSSNGEQKQPAKDVAHRTVIYFGDSNPRQREDKPIWQPPPPPTSLPEVGVQVSSRCNGIPETSPRNNDEVELRRGSVERDNSDDRNRENDDADVTRDIATQNDPGKVVHEIVVNVSPSREDVLRIEEDESQLEDYWSLPGDTSGFKADWSFVQQWRLRG